MSLLKYNALLKVIEHNSITKAASDIGYTQSGISYMIKSMEKEFGFLLLRRSKEGVQPTENALRLSPILKQLINAQSELEATIDEINNLSGSSIKVGSYNSMLLQWLPQIMKEYILLFPDTEVSLSEGTDEELTQWLISGDIDLAFTAGSTPEGFKFLELAQDPFLVVLPKGHPLCDLEEISIENLCGYSIALPDEGYYSDFIDYFNKNSQNESGHFYYSLKDASSIISIVASNLGISILPKRSMVLIPDNIILREFKEGFSRKLGITYPEKRLSPFLKGFLKTAGDVIKLQSL